MSKPYLYLAGLRKLAKKLKGTEKIHLGIRPYGFHAGNSLALVVYPFLLCKEMRKLGKEPRFRFFISINDFEQDELDGPDFRKYPFNIYPKNTSLKFTPDERHCCPSIVDHWTPIIEKIVGSLYRLYPGIKINFVRNSSIKDNKYFRDVLLDTIKDPQAQADIFRKYSNKDVLDSPLRYAGAVCPDCKSTHGRTTVLPRQRIKWECAKCACCVEMPYSFFDYWWYHKPMLASRIKIFGIDVAMSGADHYNEDDFIVRKKFLKKYFKNLKEPVMLFCPMLIALDGQKMSKSRNNTCFAKIRDLIKIAESTEAGDIALTKDMVEKVTNEVEYASVDHISDSSTVSNIETLPVLTKVSK